MSDGTSTNTKILSDLGKCLLEAARFGNTEEVWTLMSNGAPLITDWLGTTPLHLAAIYGHGSTAEILIKSGISQDCRTKVDKVPLHFACQHGHFEIVKILINGGAHINAIDMLMMTPLHWAVEANNLEICLLLLKAGVKTILKNKFHKTPLSIAKDKGYGPIEKLLAVEKFKEDTGVVQSNAYLEKGIHSVKVCRPEDFGNSNSPWKKPKTRRFPMVAGTWTGGEAPNQERLEYSERKKLGHHKRKAYQRDDLLTPFLYGLHASPNPINENAKEENNILELLSPSPISDDNSPLAEDGFTIIEGTPLEKLKETVRQSTCPSDQLDLVMSSSSVPSSSLETSTDFTAMPVSYITTTPQPAMTKNTLKVPKMTTSLENISPKPYVGSIPMIPPYVISSLPPDMNTAIPINMTTVEDLYKQQELTNPSSNMSVYCLPGSASAPVYSSNLSTVTLSQINDNLLKVGPETSFVKVNPQPSFVKVSPQTSILKVSPQKREILYTDSYPGSSKKSHVELLTKTRTSMTPSPSKSSRMSQRSISLPSPEMSSLPTKSKDPNPTIPVNIPVNMLNEVLRGVVTLHSVPVKQDGTTDHRTMETVAGITTDMGTVPLIPVSSEGGLQFIPLENSSQLKTVGKKGEAGLSVIKQEQNSDSSRTYIQHVVPAQHYMPAAAPSPYYVQPQMLPYPYPVAAPMSMLPPGYDITNSIVGNQHSIVKVSENGSIPTMPVHHGTHPPVIYLQQGGHPYYQMGAAPQTILHQPSYQQIINAPSQQTYPRAQIHPTFLQQHASPHGAVFVRAASQPVIQQQMPHYVYVDANGAIISQVPATDMSSSTKD